MKAKNLHVRCSLKGTRDFVSHPGELKFRSLGRLSPDWETMEVTDRRGTVFTEFWYSCYDQLATYWEGEYSLVTFY